MDKLPLTPRDVKVDEIEGETVRIRKQAPVDLSRLRSLQAALSAWEAPDDAAA